MRKRITQDTLSRYFNLRNQRLFFDKQSRELAKEEDILEQQIKGMLESKSKIEPGNLTCRIETGGKYPRWKEEFEKRLGKEAINEVILSTIPKEVLTVELAIKDERKSA